MPATPIKLWNALIRTHHITSRRKVAKLKEAATVHNVSALLRSGGVPGVMYVEGNEHSVAAWVDVVHSLRYKTYQMVARPAIIEHERNVDVSLLPTGLHETDSVKDFGHQMQARGVYGWWRKAMGYTGRDGRM